MTDQQPVTGEFVARPRRYFRDQRAGGTWWVRARIAVASALMGKRAWRSLYRSILEVAEHDPHSVRRFLDECYQADFGREQP